MLAIPQARNGRRCVAALAFAIFLASSCTVSLAASKATSVVFTAKLSKTSFTASNAGSVKLTYKFSKPSKSFAYALSFKKGKKWQTVKSVKKNGTFKGAKSMTVKQVFGGKSVKVGSYRLKLSVGGGSKTLSFKVTNKPSGSAPRNAGLPSISGTATQGQTLTTTNGSWSGSPTSLKYQWQRCDRAGANCRDISGAKSKAYPLGQADVASTLRVTVAASNSFGSAIARSAQTAAVTTTPLVATGSEYTCVLLASGVVECWGDNAEGQVAPSSAAEIHPPVAVSGISSAVHIAVGESTSCAVLANGKVDCWGSVFLQGTNSPPVWIGIANAIQVSVGASHGCALISDGSVQCWGSNFVGQLGDGTTDSTSSTEVADIKDAVQIAAGTYHTCAIVSQGAVKCWGLDNYGQLGAVTSGGYSNTPVTVDGISGAVQITAGAFSTCALLSGGTIKCWGDNWDQVGSYVDIPALSTPTQVPEINNAAQIGASGYRTCAALTDGSVKCWGYNRYGELGPSIPLDRPATTPVLVSGITNATGIGAGGGLDIDGTHTCAVLSGGAVKCWGRNFKGQLGDGTTSDSATPVDVNLSAG